MEYSNCRLIGVIRPAIVRTVDQLVPEGDERPIGPRTTPRLAQLPRPQSARSASHDRTTHASVFGWLKLMACAAWSWITRVVPGVAPRAPSSRSLETSGSRAPATTSIGRSSASTRSIVGILGHGVEEPHGAERAEADVVGHRDRNDSRRLEQTVPAKLRQIPGRSAGCAVLRPARPELRARSGRDTRARTQP